MNKSVLKSVEMCRSMIFFTVFFCSAFGAQSQDQEWILFGEGHDNEVRLFFVSTNWPQDVNGVFIKRKRAEENTWTELHTNPIYPSSEINKPLDNITNNQGLVSRLISKRDSLNNAGNWNSATLQQVKSTLANTGGLQNLLVAVTRDYDIALLLGFGYHDTEIPKAGTYQYGLFTDDDVDQPKQIFEWDYGSSPTYDINVNTLVRTRANSKRVKIKWEIDIESYENHQVLNGFNVFRQYMGETPVKINDVPIWMYREENSTIGELNYEEKIEKDSIPVSYYTVPVTIFNTQYGRYEVNINPAEAFYKVSMPKTNFVVDSSNSRAIINWQFPAEEEKNIQGFNVELRNNIEDNYSTINKKILSASDRSFSIEALQKEILYQCRVQVVFDSLSILHSEPLSFKYSPVIDAPVPLNLQAEFVQDGNSKFIELSWEISQNSSQVEGFNIYASFPPDSTLFKEAGLPLFAETSYRYPIDYYYSTTYHFAVTSQLYNVKESDKSEIVEVIVPSVYLPRPKLTGVNSTDASATVNWSYSSDIPDLKGFRILLDDQVLLDENQIVFSDRSAQVDNLTSGQVYKINIVAISDDGLESEASYDYRISVN